MGLLSPPPGETRSRLADWLEVHCLISTREVATRSELLSIWDISEEGVRDVDFDEETGESLEPEILEEERGQFADDVLEELNHRATALGDSYPFKIGIQGQAWRLERAPETGFNRAAGVRTARAFYTFCLLASGIRDRLILGDGVKGLTLDLPHHFQAIASEVAGRLMGGDAVSFGFPRAAGDGLREALKQLSQKIGLGRPQPDLQLWSSGKEKDGGVDVVAWREFADRRPGKLLLYGQVASGKNWPEKSVVDDLEPFLTAWFSQKPSRFFIPAIFIPFPQHHDCHAKKDAAFEDVAVSEGWLRELRFGLVVDRLRIVEAGGRLPNKRMAPIRRWIEMALAEAKAA